MKNQEQVPGGLDLTKERIDDANANEFELVDLPSDITERMRQKGATWVNISGFVSLQNFGNLTDELIGLTLTNSLKEEVDPLEKKEVDKYLSRIRYLSNLDKKWTKDEFLKSTRRLINVKLLNSLPKSIHNLANEIKAELGKNNNLNIDKCLKVIQIISKNFYQLCDRYRLIKFIKTNLENKNISLIISGYSAYCPPIYLKLLPHVQELEIQACRGDFLAGTAYLQNLKKINITNAIGLHSLSDVTHNDNVRELVIQKASQFNSFSGIEHFPRIEVIEIHGVASSITDMSQLINAVKLNEVKVIRNNTDSQINEEAFRMITNDNQTLLRRINECRQKLGYQTIKYTSNFYEKRTFEANDALGQALGALFNEENTGIDTTTVGTGIETLSSGPAFSFGDTTSSGGRESTTSSNGSASCRNFCCIS